MPDFLSLKADAASASADAFARTLKSWNPADAVTHTLKQASVSLTIGVFMGAALTTGIACGVAAAYFANSERLLALRDTAVTAVYAARDAALGTREGQAISRMLNTSSPVTAPPTLAAPPAAPKVAPSPSRESRTPTHNRAAPPPSVGSLSGALRSGEALPAVLPPAGAYLPYSVSGNTVYLSGCISRHPDGSPICGALADGAHLSARRQQVGLGANDSELTRLERQVLSKSGTVLKDSVTGAPLLDSSAGAAAARTCALRHLAVLQTCCGGLANVKRVHKATVFVVAASGGPPFADSPTVANGYSDLINAALGEPAWHARSAICVAALPLGAAVEVEAVVELHDPSLCVRSK